MPRMSVRAILSALPYVIENEIEQLKYRIYVTDALYVISNGRLSKRYYDIANVPKPREDDRTGDEIAADVIERIGLSYESI